MEGVMKKSLVQKNAAIDINLGDGLVSIIGLTEKNGIVLVSVIEEGRMVSASVHLGVLSTAVETLTALEGAIREVRGMLSGAENGA